MEYEAYLMASENDYRSTLINYVVMHLFSFAAVFKIETRLLDKTAVES